MKEILKDGKYGRLVPVDDETALTEAIEKTFKNPIDKDKLKERAKDFSAEKITEKYLDVMGVN